MIQAHKPINNWYVITGGPGSGKTTVINVLKDKGYHVVEENARHFIDTQRVKGKTVEEVKQNQKKFQTTILKLQVNQEKALITDELVFLDRAIPDALAYHRFFHLEVDEQLKNAMNKVCYKKVFIMEPLPLVNDYARLENEEAQIKIHQLITEVYTSLPCPIIHVPVLPVEERVDFILKSL